VKEHVNIPHHVQFWGIDSGIRHSVGGADYGSVRVGTFMGRRIIQGTASKVANSFMKAREEADDVELALSTEDAEEEYLCNIPPHRYTPLNRQSLCAPLSIRSEELVTVLLHAEV
jgi:L-arabinokinase